MGVVLDFLYYTVFIVFVENIVFTRGLGSSKIFLLQDDKKLTLIFGGSVAVATLVSTIVAYFVERPFLFLNQNVKNIIFPAIFIIIIVLIYILIYYLLNLLSGKKIAKILINMLPMVLYNYVVFGVMLLCARRQLVLYQRLGFALGAGIGYVLASMLLVYTLEYLDNVWIPKAFRGIPVKIMFIGLLSLAFFGFSGHELPF